MVNVLFVVFGLCTLFLVSLFVLSFYTVYRDREYDVYTVKVKVDRNPDVGRSKVSSVMVYDNKIIASSTLTTDRYFEPYHLSENLKNLADAYMRGVKEMGDQNG